MGRIKPTLVKRTSNKIFGEFKTCDNFEDNKKIIRGLMPSKKIRNLVAGHLTKLSRKNNAKQKA